MTAATHPPVHGAPRRPFDHRRSRKLDELILLIESCPPRLRLRCYRLHKRWLERHVPAWPAGRAR